MQQDRLNIKEMPIVMKRMSANELGFRNELYSGAWFFKIFSQADRRTRCIGLS